MPFRTLVEKKRGGVPFAYEECAAASSVLLAGNVGAFEAGQYWLYSEDEDSYNSICQDRAGPSSNQKSPGKLVEICY